MAGKLNISIGKNFLRLSSMLLAVIMLVLTVFVGTAPVNVQAETSEFGNVIVGSDSKNVFCGQNVVLEAGKTYSFSYYYSGAVFLPGWIMDGDDTGATSFTPTNTVYDDEYHKVTYEFVAPTNATSAGEEGKVIIYLGVRMPTADTYYFYNPSVYAVDDATKTNLFTDADFSGETTLVNGSDRGNWHKPYASTSGKLGWKFSVKSLEEVGGIDTFKKTDASRYALKMAKENKASTLWFGQRVELEVGKTYELSNYYTGAYMYQKVMNPNDSSTIEGTTIVYDNDYFKQGLRFTVTSDYPDGSNGKKLVWVGLQGYNSSKDEYLYDFKLYDIENPDVNLLKDAALLESGTAINTAVWQRPGGATNIGNFSKVSLADAGGMDTFKKTDADRYVLKLEPNTSGQPVFGQTVSLKAGKTYVFSNYYLPGTDPIQWVCDGDNFDNAITYEVIEDTVWSKQGIKFTVPDTAPDDTAIEGNKLVWVGFRGHYRSSDLYYYGFELYNVDVPNVNLLSDCALIESATPSSSAVWKAPSGSGVSAKYSRVTLESAGGIDIYKKAENVLVASNAKNVFCGQNLILDAGKTYSFSYYYEEGKFLPAWIIDGNGTDNGGAEISITNTVYDNEYNKVTYEFVASESATAAGEGKVNIYLGIRPTTVDTYRFYGFDVHAVDDEAKTNLFNDPYFTTSNSLYPATAGVAGNWYKPYADGPRLTTGKYSTVTFNSLGGLEYFKKTDAGRYVLRLEPKSSGMPWFGQWVTLEEGKTYVFSNCYLAGTDLHQKIYYKHDDNQYDLSDLTGEVIYDTEWSRQGIKFTVPTDAPDDGNGKVLIWVGIRGYSYSNYLYYYDFELYDVESPNVNLLSDSELLENGTALNTAVWKTAGGEIKSVYTKVTLDTIGGMNTFMSYEKKCDVNGDGIVNICDLVRVNNYVTGETTDADIIADRGDLDIDSTVSESDLLLLQKELLK